MSSTTKPKIAISACLLGENVRFNGGHKQSLLCSQTLADYFDFVPLCPEVAIGLGIPREPIRAQDRVKAFLKEVRSEPRGPQLFLSRTAPEFLIELFEDCRDFGVR